MATIDYSFTMNTLPSYFTDSNAWYLNTTQDEGILWTNNFPYIQAPDPFPRNKIVVEKAKPKSFNELLAERNR